MRWPSTIRAALVLGLGAIFALWLLSVYALVRRVAEVEQRASLVHTRFAQSEELLSTIQTQVLLGSIYLRDALLEVGPATTPTYRERLRRIRAEVAQAIAQKAPVVDSPVEREHWSRMQAEVADFMQTIQPGLEWESAPQSLDVPVFLRDRVIPKREVIVDISDQIRALNRAAVENQRSVDANLYTEIQRTVWVTTAIAGLLGVATAVLVTRHASRLESQIQTQHHHILRNKRDLERLSTKLVSAQEEERRMIARELHDEIGQALTAIKMGVTLSERHLDVPGEPERSLVEVRSITDRALQMVRDLSQLLHPAMLDDLGLPATLKWYLRRFSERTGIRAELVQEHVDARLAREIETCAYRVVQEALTNVARHSRARSCRVYLQGLPQTVLLTIEDDGTGFDLAQVRGGQHERGLGLLGIQERVASLRGVFRLESNPGKGTRLTVELPAVAAIGADSVGQGRLRSPLSAAAERS